MQKATKPTLTLLTLVFSLDLCEMQYWCNRLNKCLVWMGYQFQNPNLFVSHWLWQEINKWLKHFCCLSELDKIFRHHNWWCESVANSLAIWYSSCVQCIFNLFYVICLHTVLQRNRWKAVCVNTCLNFDFFKATGNSFDLFGKGNEICRSGCLFWKK